MRRVFVGIFKVIILFPDFESFGCSIPFDEFIFIPHGVCFKANEGVRYLKRRSGRGTLYEIILSVVAYSFLSLNRTD